MTVDATNRHYDQAPEIFEAFLDRRMKYTCGVYADGDETLDQAQENKLRIVADLLGLSGGERVLDIGSGWGSMVCFLASLGCEVTGVTPSPKQAGYIRARAKTEQVDNRVTVDCSDFYETELTGSAFDAVTIVGVIEAMPDHVTVLRKIAQQLKPGGRVYLSASCFRNTAMYTEYADRPASRHVSEEIFGYGVLRPLSALVEGFEQAHLSIIGCYDLTDHYRRTIDAWIDRVDHARATIDGSRPGYADELIRYFRTANAGWGHTTRHYGLVGTRSRLGQAVVVR